jgi:hypothetical protein
MKSTNTLVMRTIRIYFVSALLMIFSLQSFATTYYSRTSGGNWNASTTWSTVTYGSPTNSGTYPKIGDAAFIGDGYTININATVVCANVTVGEGRSGILKYLSGGNYVLNVTGNLSVNRGAKFWYNTAVNQTHTCQVGGNFTNNGVVDFYYAPSQIVNLIFNGNSNSNVGGTGTWDLNDVSLNKNTSPDNYVSANTSTFEAAIRNFIGIYGTYIHNNSGSYSLNPASGNYTIGPNVKFKVPAGSMWFSSLASTLTLQGSLYVTGGTVTVGSSGSAGSFGLLYDQFGSPVPYLEVTSGTLNVYGGLSYASGSALDPMGFKMTGGTINVNTGVTGSSTHLFCVNDVANSSFFMSGGTIILQKPNTGGFLNFDVGIYSGIGSVTTGGTIQFGNGSTASGSYFSFVPLPSAVYPHFYITGPAGNAVSLAPSVNATADFKLLSLRISSNNTFDIKSISGTGGFTKQMTLLSNVPATTNAFVNDGTFVPRNGNVIFNGSTAQGIGGNTITTFWQLTMNNPAGVTLNKPANISNYLYLTSGNLNTTNTNILTCGANANCDLGSASTFVDGPMIHTVASSLLMAKTYPFGKAGIHRPAILTVKHVTSTPVTYRGEIFNSSASALPFTLPPTISRVSSVRYVKFIRQAVANFTSGGIQMYYGTDDVVLDYTTLVVGQDDGVSQWRSIGGAATANGTGYISSGTFTQFTNYFALANPPGGMNPLPVTLTKFNAKRDGGIVDIGWTTSAEINCDHFTVERSINNRDYTTVQVVYGAGNSVVAHTYKANDVNPLKGLTYYRIKQSDYDGTAQVFPPVSVSTSVSPDLSIYPTVSNGKSIHMTNSDNDMGTYNITVQNMSGKIVPASIRPNGYGVDLSVEDNTSGMYIITATRGSDILKDRIIISQNN